MNFTSLFRCLPCLFLATILFSGLPIFGQIASFENAPINYQTAEVNDPVAGLIKQLESGDAQLEYDQKYGYLKSVLEHLEVPISSQTLVFSKTSLQVHRISPARPRAVYFNDDIYIGYCQNGEVLEIGATDAKQGPTFYSVKQEESDSPIIKRDQGQCIVCHASSRTQNVPGYLIRSVFPNRSGHPNFGSGTYTTDSTSPFRQRWGGWYVTGTHGDLRHMGNKVYAEDERNDQLEEGANQMSLEEFVSTKPYLSAHSDLVALMVMEHQTQMHNAITYANFETRQALHQSFEMNKILKRETGFVSESAQRRIKSATERVVEHLLMCDEFALSSPVAGSGKFTAEFEAKGMRDSKQRSLREFDLKTRMFRYPCSYLIYSPAFDGLPNEVRIPIVRRLVQVLEGRDDSDRYDHLSAQTKTAILEILKETKPELASLSADSQVPNFP
ncbi:MAG: hypothetical protein ACI814_004140 [Mariniblastus sp.]|jgi:hypothetical protein